jgi:hypothetical protein
MTAFNAEAIAKDIAQRCQPTGSYGCVFELWMDAYDRNTRLELAGVPEEHEEAVKAHLIKLGAMHPDDMEDNRAEEGLCIHYLDERTCPCGCFE